MLKRRSANKLAHAVHRYWMNLAGKGNPNGQGLLDWPTYSPSNQGPHIMSFRCPNTTLEHDESHYLNCDMWRDFDKEWKTRNGDSSGYGNSGGHGYGNSGYGSEREEADSDCSDYYDWAKNHNH